MREFFGDFKKFTEFYENSLKNSQFFAKISQKIHKKRLILSKNSQKGGEMKDSEIKTLRMQSILKELIPEALASLEDESLRNLCITDVECKKGRYDAFVFVDKMFFNEQEQGQILAKLERAAGALQSFCASEQGWFRCPKFHFKFDERLEYQNHIDELFKKIKNERES